MKQALIIFAKRCEIAHEAQVLWFLSILSAYWRAKKSELTEIIVVFDGGLFSHKTREIVGGIVTVYAGGGRKADDVLVAYAGQFRERGLLVTNDRELQRRAFVGRTPSINVADFWRLIEGACQRKLIESGKNDTYGECIIMKYEEVSDDILIDENELDRLMISGSLVGGHHFKNEDLVADRFSASKTVAKKDKLRQAIHKKLG